MNIGLPSVAEELERLPEVKVEGEQEDRLLVRVARHAVPVHIVTRASGYPRDVRQAVWQAKERLGPRANLLLRVPSLSSGSREWLQQEGVGYLDGLGNLFLAAEGIYIFRESAQKPAKSPIPVETNIFRGRTTRVLHTLLHTPERRWHVTDLAEEAGVAAGTAIRVCETLEKMLLMEREGRGPHSLRWLNAPGKLLDAWAEKHRLDASPIHRYYRWMTDLDKLAAAIGEAVEGQGAAYGVTLGVGALHRAPFLTHVEQLALWIPASVDWERLAADCRLKAAEEGPNVLLLSTRTEGPLMYRQKGENVDFWLVSDIQLYLDLYASPGRNKEQAEHLRRERIGF